MSAGSTCSTTMMPAILPRPGKATTMPSQVKTTDDAGRSGTIDRGDGIELAYAARDGARPAVVFFPGFSSDMTGTKATFLDSLCAERGQAFLRFDYSGH